MTQSAGSPMWLPDEQLLEQAAISRFSRDVEAHLGWSLPDYASLHRWSVEQPAQFWSSIWKFGEVRGEMGMHVVEDAGRMPGTRWFPQARLNFAENLLRSRDDSDALVFWGEDEVKNRLSHGELYREVARFAAALRDLGVKEGDRVAAWMPNMPETVIAMLAAASIGAIFSSASPDFGVQGLLDRFGQIEPKVLIACDGYHYNGKVVDCLAKVGEAAVALRSLQKVVVVPYVHAGHDLSGVRH
ncbi:MAG: AMP-binding protein, partial [Zoogloea sp.]|nr:AMP-binding protein [Zoogloea sp.]